MRSFITLLLVLAASSCRSRPPRVLDAAEGRAPVTFPSDSEWSYRIGPSDVLRINVFGHPELSSMPLRRGEVGTPVDGSGNAQLPLVGEVSVAGRTASEAADAVEEALRAYLRDPRVDVAVVEANANRFFVSGAVKEPGAFSLDRPTSLLEAIGLAGGFDTGANRGQIAWVRGPLEQENLQLVDARTIDPLLAGGLRPGDLVFVARRSFVDGAEAARDVLPILQAIALPLSIGLQAATLEKIN